MSKTPISKAPNLAPHWGAVTKYVTPREAERLSGGRDDLQSRIANAVKLSGPDRRGAIWVE